MLTCIYSMYMYFVGYRLYYLYYIMRSPSSMPVSVKHKDLFINCWEIFYGIWDVPSGVIKHGNWKSTINGAFNGNINELNW